MNGESHRPGGSGSRPVVERLGLVWSHDQFRRAEFWRPLRADDDPHSRELVARYEEAVATTKRLRRTGRELLAEQWAEREGVLYDKLGDPRRQPRLLLPVAGDAAGELAYEELPALTLAMIANWVYGSPVELLEHELATILEADEFARLVELEAALAQAPKEASPTGRGERHGREPLRGLLAEGLANRDGYHLSYRQLLVYGHLVARGLPLGSLRVCEDCLLVHRALRARRCRHCRKSPTRWTQRPWHLRILLPDRSPRRLTYSVVRRRAGVSVFVSSQMPRVAHLCYIGTCRGCGADFVEKRGDVSFCAACQEPRERTRRSRASRTRPP